MCMFGIATRSGAQIVGVSAHKLISIVYRWCASWQVFTVSWCMIIFHVLSSHGLQPTNYTGIVLTAKQNY